MTRIINPRIVRESNTKVAAVWQLSDFSDFQGVKVHWYIKTESNPAWLWQAEETVTNYGEEFTTDFTVPEEANGVNLHLAVLHTDWNDTPIFIQYEGNPRTNEPVSVSNGCTVTEFVASGSSSTQVSWTCTNTEVDHFEVILQGLYNGGWYKVSSTNVDEDDTWSAQFSNPSTDYARIRVLVRPVPDSGQWKCGWVYSNEMVNPAYSAAEREKMAQPSVPSVSASYSSDYSRILVEWSSTDELAHLFEVWRSVDGGNFSKVASYVKSSTTSAYRHVDAPAAGKAYRYRLRAVNTYNGSNAYAESAMTSYVYGPPAVPTGLALSVYDSDAESAAASVLSTWSQSGNSITLGGYDLQYTDAPSFGGSGDQSASPTASDRAWRIEGMTANIAWLFRLRSKNGSGNSSWTPVKSIVPKVRPITPTCSYELTQSKNVKVTITSSDTAAKWVRVYRSSPGGEWAKVADLKHAASVLYEDFGTLPGGKYRYYATTVLEDGETESQPSQTQWTDDDWLEREPAAPSGLSAAATSASGTKGTVTLTFDDEGMTGDGVYVRYTDNPDVDLLGASSGYDTKTFGPPENPIPIGQGVTVQITDLDTASTWRFAMKRTCDAGESTWALTADGAAIVSALVATKPEAPTLTPTKSAYAAGDEIPLEWAHNCADGSVQQDAIVQVSTDDGETWETLADDLGQVTWYDYTPDVESGTEIMWRVKTQGLLEWGDSWSEALSFTVWAPANASIELLNADYSPLDDFKLEELPLRVSLSAEVDASGENDVIEWWVEVTSMGGFESLNADGTVLKVADGETVYSAILKVGDPGWVLQSNYAAQFDIGVADMVFSGGYRVTAGCLTAQGLRSETGEAYAACAMTGSVPEPDLECQVADDWSCALSPVCRASDGTLAPVTLAVYRIESDGSAVEVASGMANDGSAQASDLYPNFGTCTYRVVAQSPTTGAQSMKDVAVEVDTPGVYIQWDGGSVMLPYDLELGESYDPDVALMGFEGRKHPVPVFGTQLGQKESWKTNVSKRDHTAEVESLRKLAGLMAPCHVREPSGTGYDAFVKVSNISRANNSGKVSISLEVTRVDAT